MYIGMRWATATNIGKAVELTTAASAHLRDKYDWNIVGAMGLTGPSGRIGFLSLNDSLGELLDRRTRVATDPELAELLADAADIFVPGSSIDYILNVIHGEPGGGDSQGDLLFFRAIGFQGMLTGDIIANAVQIADHLESVHGLRSSVSSSLGGDGAGLLFASRHESGDHIDQLGQALAADEQFAKMAAVHTDKVTRVSDRIVRMLT